MNERREGLGGATDIQLGLLHAPEGEMYFTELEPIMPEDLDKQEVRVLFEQEGI